jgi:cell division control protein 24
MNFNDAVSGISNDHSQQFPALSLYQQCAMLESQLLRIRGFTAFLELASTETPNEHSHADPVSRLWSCFALGTPLCFIFNLLPDVTPIDDASASLASIHECSPKSSKRAILHFAMAIRGTDLRDQLEHFDVSELLSRNGTDGLAKVSDYHYPPL